MGMDIRVLRYIAEIAKTKNLTKAASNLYVSQPALSKALKKAEMELECLLFYRDGSAMIPTDSGEVLLERADTIIKEFSVMNESLLDLKKLRKGHVSLGLPPIVSLLYFPPLIYNFRKKYPDIQLNYFEYGAMMLADKIMSDEIDLAVGMRPIFNDGLNEIPIVSKEIGIAVRKTHPFAQKKAVSMNDLKGVPIITFTSDFMVHHHLMGRYADAGIKPVFDLLSTDCNLMVEFARLSGGVCILPRPALEYYINEEMTTVSFEPRFNWELSLVFKKNAYMSHATKALISCCQSYFSEFNQAPA